jgi:hypothetical protein
MNYLLNIIHTGETLVMHITYICSHLKDVRKTQLLLENAFYEC